jgi:hypothetical protein
MAEVERQGGAHQSGLHEPEKFKIDQPVPGKDGKMQTVTAHTTGCNREALFVIPYDPARHVKVPHYLGPNMPAVEMVENHVTVAENNAMMKRGAGFLRVCAHDDDVARWPRFAKALEEL